jgi:DNA-binding transcriptional regulator YiaG
MRKDLFDELLESVREGGAILRGEKAASREFILEDPDVRGLRESYGLSQPKFAALLGISVGTLRNWEQGRRRPEGSARVLLQIVAKHPDALLDMAATSQKLSMAKLTGWNEESVKNRLLLPYLHRLGFSSSELHFEVGVSVRIGRTVHKASSVGGRLDILIRGGQTNLFLVEVKAEGLDLSDDDRDQAISYALLVEPIAPVVLLSNGTDHRLFETLTRRPLEEEEVTIGKAVFRLTPPPDLKAAYDEAVMSFLGYSPDNLLAFCRQQTAELMRSLKGSSAERSRKYIPEVFIRRQALLRDVADFRASSKPLLSLVGDAGTGKTCCLCGLADALLEQGHPVLFYRGFALQGPILSGVAEDFNWTFSEEQSGPHLIRRLDQALRDRTLTIILDAIDEWEIPLRIQDLVNTARHLSGSRIKLIVSCKTSAWREFLFRNGTATGLDNYAFSPHEGQPYVVLSPMSDSEFLAAVDRYSSFYSVSGYFETDALRAARSNLFLLRILYEVAAQEKSQNLTFSSIEFFRRYYDQALSPLNQDRQAGEYLLAEAARLLYESGQERIDSYQLWRAIKHPYVEQLLGRLQHLGILESVSTPGGEQIAFYFSLLRDYLIAFRVLRWHELTDDGLATALEAIGDAGVQIEALAFFYRHASTSQRRLLDAQCFEHATEFTRFYDQILRTEFPQLRNRFSPFTTGPLGFVGELILRESRVFLYGFRPRDPTEEEVLFVPAVRMSLPERSNLAELHGAIQLHHSTDFRAPQISFEVLHHEIARPLRQLVDRGDLDESTCPELAQETVAALVASNRQIFSDTRHAESAGPLFPINVAAVRQWLRYELLREHFHELREQQKLSDGTIQVSLLGNGAIGYSWEPTVDDLAWIDSQARSHLGEVDLDVRRRVERSIESGLASLDRRMSAALDTLEAHGVKAIEGHPFAGAAELFSRVWHGPRPSATEVGIFLEQLLPVAVGTLRRLVAHNFPSMAEDFFSIACQPLFGVGRLGLFQGPQFWSATLFFCEPDAGATEDRFAFREWNSLETRILRDPAFRFELQLDGEWRVRLEVESGSAGLVQRNIPLPGVFRPGHDYLDRRRFTATQPPFPVLRAMVYNLLRAELPAAFTSICRRYGVTPPDPQWALFSRSLD